MATCFVAIFWRGGTMEHESLSFYKHYTADRPFIQKVFDSHTNDFGTYQARELSYFFDALNATLYQRIAGVAPEFFVPPTSLLIPVVLALVFAVGVRRTALNLDGVTACLLLACFFSSFVFISTLSLFYRSGKPLLPIFILAYLFQVRHVHLARAENPMPGWRVKRGGSFVAFALAITIGLLDLQGVVYVSAAAAILLLHWALTRRLFDLALATGLAAVALQLYNRVLGPRLIHALNGYWPNFGYQDVPTSTLPIVPAMELMGSNAVVMLGGFWPVTALAVVVFVALLAAGRRRGEEGSPVPPALSRSAWARGILYVGLVIAANIAMFTLMTARHPAIYQMQDHRHWYYPLPWLALILFALTIGVNAAWPHLGRNARRGLQVVLLGLVIGNIAALPRLKEIMMKGPWYSLVHPQSERLKTYLRTGVDDPLLAGNYKEFGAQVRATHSKVGR